MDIYTIMDFMCWDWLNVLLDSTIFFFKFPNIFFKTNYKQKRRANLGPLDEEDPKPLALQDYRSEP